MSLTHFFKWNPTSREDEPLEPVDVEMIPTATIEWKNGEKTLAGPDLTALLTRGANLKAQHDALKDQLDAIKTEILSMIDPGVTIRIESVATIVISARELITISNPTLLQDVLGSRFEDLVRIETKYYPTPKLRALADDHNNPLAQLISSTLKIDQSTSISYRAP